MTGSPAQPSLSAPVKVAQLNARKPVPFDLQPDAALRASIAHDLGLLSLRKFRFQGELRPLGRQDWEISASLGATVVQSCAVTLDPVTTRIDETVQRRYLAQMPEPQGHEIEMPDDDTQEALGAMIDPGSVAIEALALAIPAFPRIDGATLPGEGTLSAAPEGAAPLPAQERPKPFAGLAGLREKLMRDQNKD
ncbi:YceD family protein [Roseinatronobacter alkalisoli]|uniref:DUF177 domain-containing protein n=1 Tax=Roseinatronobacter alkalisoli TaxID=3028235 RepID=A0ABT5T8N0_9RHOB|nr:DUF177 domain-containing protein [Roseinatronobacter sp. HJB301]MDD7971482.1 DUF177 domain-containing protein [Roseinatronobacter sp. HJB301]